MYPFVEKTKEGSVAHVYADKQCRDPGMEGFLVSVEADVSNGLPGFSISGQLALEVREAQERVRTGAEKFRFSASGKENNGKSVTGRKTKGGNSL